MSALRGFVQAPATLAIIILLAVAVLDIEASARGMGGGVRGGGRGVSFGHGVGGASFGHGFGAAGFGRASPGFGHGSGRSAPIRSYSAPHIGPASIGARAFSGNHFAGRTITTGSFSHRANIARVHHLFGNRVITNAAFQSAHVPFRFRGRFFGSPWPWWWGGFVVGWIGPVFWPYAYYDFFDYVFWPYAYDDFWPYAYDDIYYGIYGPYAYSGPPAPVSSGDPSAGSSPRQLAQPKEDNARQRVHTRGSARAPEVCSNTASELTQWPIERISQVVQPTDAQRALLDELKVESAKAIDLLKSACPNDLPSTPTGRLAAMQSRIETMLTAVKTVHPALDRFYQSLTDEQKARFNAIAQVQDSAAVKDQRNLLALCGERAPGVTDLPIDRIATVVQPNESQRAALDALREASANAAASLKADCPTYQVLTPVARIEAMEQRLAATLTAVKTVDPALTKFYELLTDEQKARFITLRSTGQPQG
jgi:hypothetical protein